MKKKLLILCTTDSMIWTFLLPHISYLSKHGVSVECACSKTGIYFQELIYKYELTVHEVPFCRSPYNLKNYTAFRLLKDLTIQNGYNAIFCHEPVGGAVGRLIGHYCHIKVFYMAHGFHFYKGAPFRDWIIYYNVEKYLSKFTDVLITINKEDYSIAQQFYAKQVFLANGIGVDLDKFKKMKSNYLRERFNLNDNDIAILSVGELIDRKNHATIINAIAQLNKKNVHLFIAGEGILRDKLNTLILKYNLQAQIHMLGFCYNMSELYNSCDIFIFPSVQEGLSMALMEAMACAKPVIVSRIRGNIDLINEHGGVLVDTYDIKGYQEAINRLISDKEVWNSYGSYNENVVKKYSIENVIEQLRFLIDLI